MRRQDGTSPRRPELHPLISEIGETLPVLPKTRALRPSPPPHPLSDPPKNVVFLLTGRLSCRSSITNSNTNLCVLSENHQSVRTDASGSVEDLLRRRALGE